MAARPLNDIARTGIIHVHSDYSHDGCDTLERLGEVSHERGIGFVGLTDHAEDFNQARYQEYQARCREYAGKGTRLVAGLEFRFAGFPGLHLLALDLREWIEPANPGEFMAMTRGRAGFTIVAHPVLPDYVIPPDVLAGIDAIEVWNAAYNTRYFPDFRAIRLLHRARKQRPALVGTAGLDQHDCRNDRETRVILDRESDDPIAELRAGRFQNRGRTMDFDPAVAWSPLRIAALSSARWVFDRMERVQERVGRALRKRSRRRPSE
jgi:hypothetical protein